MQVRQDGSAYSNSCVIDAPAALSDCWSCPTHLRGKLFRSRLDLPHLTNSSGTIPVPGYVFTDISESPPTFLIGISPQPNCTAKEFENRTTCLQAVYQTGVLPIGYWAVERASLLSLTRIVAFHLCFGFSPWLSMPYVQRENYTGCTLHDLIT